MVNIILKNCIKKHDDANKIIKFYPMDNGYKIKLESNEYFNFEIKTKNKIKIKCDFENIYTLNDEFKKFGGCKRVTINNDSVSKKNKISKIYISNIKIIDDKTKNLLKIENNTNNKISLSQKNILKNGNEIVQNNIEYKIFINGKISNSANIQFYNELKKLNIMESSELNVKSSNHNTVWIIFNLNKNIKNKPSKYILINDEYDKTFVSKSEYTIVSTINIINENKANKDVYKKLLLNNSENDIKLILVAIGILDVSDVDINLDKDKINILSLTTSNDRLSKFIDTNGENLKLDENKYNIVMGIKHNPGFVGCGLSYKMIINNAHKQKLEYVKICEDDCKINNMNIIDAG